jgi:hypothetical protein
MLLLGLPWLLLAFSAWRATRGVETGRAEALTRVRQSPYLAHGGLSEPQSRPQSSHSTIAMSASEFTTSDNSGLQLAAGSYTEMNFGAGEVAFEDLTDQIPSPSLEQQERALQLALAAAKSERDDAALSRNSVLLARILLTRSARGEAAQLLQSAALSARRAKLPVLHAEARIELAELARSDGDMTSACEHWQMAKVMFHETGQRPDQDRISDLMRQHRCPTDWVLTNF